MRLSEIAKVVRSKNAGPRRLTLDVMFAGADDYNRVQQAGVLTAQRVAPLYGLEAADVEVIEYAAAWAIKIVLPRAVTAGDPGDRDVYGAQQHGPILEIEL